MCGRFRLTSSAEKIGDLFQIKVSRAIAPRYNICPTQPVEIVRISPASNQPELSPVLWGLIPPWSKDLSLAAKMINARAETAHEKPSFKNCLKRRRCLIPVDGFYEWQQNVKPKQPFHIRMKDGQPFALAGIWEIWHGPNGEEIESCAILTTEANELMKPFHHRMPVILRADQFPLWLDPDIQELEQILPLLRQFPAEEMLASPVARTVNNPRIDDARCIEEIAV